MTPKKKPRIYADFHNVWEAGQAILDRRGTLADLKELGTELTDGLEVVLYMDDADTDGNSDDLEVDAVVHLHPELGKWIGCFDDNGFRHASDRDRKGRTYQADIPGDGSL